MCVVVGRYDWLVDNESVSSVGESTRLLSPVGRFENERESENKTSGVSASADDQSKKLELYVWFVFMSSWPWGLAARWHGSVRVRTHPLHSLNPFHPCSMNMRPGQVIVKCQRSMVLPRTHLHPTTTLLDFPEVILFHSHSPELGFELMASITQSSHPIQKERTRCQVLGL